MEIRTCEQYVLAELKEAYDRIAGLHRELDAAKRENGELREQMKPTHVEQAISTAGRELIFRTCFMRYVDIEDGGELVPFKDWCIDSTFTHLIPRGLSKAEFIDAFEPEFLEEYNQLIAEGEE